MENLNKKEVDLLNTENLENISLHKLIKLIEYFKFTCLLKVFLVDLEGYILFEDGFICNVKTSSDINGENGLITILEWDRNSLSKKEIFILKKVDQNIEREISDKKINEEDVDLSMKVFQKINENTLKKLDTNESEDLIEELIISESSEYMKFCQNILDENGDIMAISVCEINDKDILGYSFREEELTFELVIVFLEMCINSNINIIQSLKNIFSDFETNESGYEKYPPINEFFFIDEYFKISKILNDKYLIHLIFNQNISKVIALKNIQKYSNEFEKLIKKD